MDITVDVSKSLNVAKDLVLRPKKTVKSIEKKDSWKKTFSYLVVIAFVGHLLTGVFNYLIYPIIDPFLSQFLGANSGFEKTQVLPAIIMSYVLTLALSFVWGGALKLWLKLFKVNSTFDEAYKVVVYPRTANYLFGWLPFVNMFAAFYSFYIMMLMLVAEYGMSKKKAFAIVLTSTLAVIILLFVLLFSVPRV